MRSASVGRARGAVPVRPHRTEQVARRAEGGVVDAGVRGDTAAAPSTAAPSRRRWRARRAARPPPPPVAPERGEDAEVADEPVEVGVRRRRGQSARGPGSRSRRPARCSSSVHGRASRTSASTCASPPMPLCIPSRSSGGPPSCGTVSGIHGPSSHRTWSSTQRQAASPRSAYVSCEVIRRSSPFIPGRAARRPSPTGCGRVLDDLRSRPGVLHRQPGAPLEVADDRGAELRVGRESASSAARLIVAAKRCRCAGVMSSPRGGGASTRSRRAARCRSSARRAPRPTSRRRARGGARETPPGKKPARASSASTRS